MILKHKYFYYTKGVSEKDCNKILAFSENRPKEKGVINPSGFKQRGIRTMDPKTQQARKCTISWVNETWIYDLLNPFIHQANYTGGWNFQWDWNESCQITIYTKGGYYDWHADQHDNAEMYKDKSINFNNKIRKLSLTLQLTESSKYEGGDFQFQWLDRDKIKITTVKKARELGTVIIFPSFMWHRITPITKGTRRSLVNWSIGKPFI